MVDEKLKQSRAEQGGPAEEREAEEVQARTAPPGKVVYAAIYNEACHELERKPRGLAWSGLAAGLSMGFSMIAQALLQVHLPDQQWAALVTPFGYTIGFLIVILGRQQLFTENTLTPILALINNSRMSVLKKVGQLWGVVLVTNLLGGLIFAAVIAKTEMVDAETRQACLELADKAVSHGFGVTLLRGILAGWLIALMVWLLPFAESARIWVIVLISYLVGLGGFSHVIAGGIEAFYLAVAGNISLVESFTLYIIPTLIGNTIGGVALVAALVHAQFVGSERKQLLRRT